MSYTVEGIEFKNQMEYREYLARKKGFKNYREYQDNYAKMKGYEGIIDFERECCWNRGFSSPMSENEDCPLYLGVYITERKIARKILPIIFGGIEKEMPPNYPGYDFIVKGGYKINVKGRMLICNKWYFMIRYNKIADYFLLVAFSYWQDENSLRPIHIWLFNRNDKIRKSGGTGYKELEFYKRHGFGVTNEDKYLSKFIKYEIKDIIF